MTRRRAFTLIELLVVIAIIAILAAILFPVFAKAREKARQSSCQSNEKQLLLGLIQYSQDYDERWPGRSMNSEDYQWRLLVQPYLKSSQVFVCPSNTCSEWGTGGFMANTFRRSYACNGHDAFNTPMRWSNGQSLAALTAPAQTILVCESREWWSEMNLDYADDNWTGRGPSLFCSHMSMGNFGFCDGHVKSMKASQTATTSVFMWDQNPQQAAPANIIANMQSVDQQST